WGRVPCSASVSLAPIAAGTAALLYSNAENGLRHEDAKNFGAWPAESALTRISHQPRRGVRLWPTAQAVGPQAWMQPAPEGRQRSYFDHPFGIAFFRPYRGLFAKRLVSQG
ncbi:MAG: hypothetical protein ACRD88_14645, partial [Terriglobia bacterium]